MRCGLHQLCLDIKWCANGFAILHAKPLEHLFNVAPLVHGDGAGCSIPLNMDSKEEVQSLMSYSSSSLNFSGRTTSCPIQLQM